MSPKLLHGDCIEEMAKLHENSVDAIVTDPPYGLGFMGKKWDDLPPGLEFAEQALRVLKPGGHLLAFGGTRTYHRLACAIEDAGFEIRDCLAWLYGSGFPKSHNVGGAIDRHLGAEREVIGTTTPGIAPGSGNAVGGNKEPVNRYAPATPEAAQWQGWGTALKPAHEPIVLARKPLTGTVAANVLEHGTGAINVDGCRVGTEGGTTRTEQAEYPRNDDGTETIAAGRWPANVILDPEAGAMLDEQSGNLRPATSRTKREKIGGTDRFLERTGDLQRDEVYPDSGGASRFFYCAKASKRERNAGLEGFEERAEGIGDPRPSGQSMVRLDGRAPRTAQNVHPTVKPIALMRWLVRLVTPPNGTVLDPFLGSGTTGIAAKLEGFDFIGIEREAEYLAIAQARIAHHEPEPEPAQLELAA